MNKEQLDKAKKLLAIKEQIKSLEADAKQYEDEFKSMSAFSYTDSDITITVSDKVRQGSYDIDRISKDYNFDKTLYKKPDVNFKEVRLTKNNTAKN